MTTDGRVSRRRALQALGLSAVAGLAGCGTFDGSGDGGTPIHTASETATPTDVDTVVVTKTPADDESETATATDDDTATPTVTATEPLTFAGGGAQAFADALDVLQDNPGATLAIEPGTYRLDPTQVASPEDNYAFDVRGLEGNTIDGNGATLEFTDPTYGMFIVRGGSDLSIIDLTLDFRPPPFTQGTIVSLDTAAKTLTLELDDGYPRPDSEIFDRNPRHYATVHTADGDYVRGIRGKANDGIKRFSSVERVGDRRYECSLSQYTYTTGLQEGRKLAYLARGGGGHPLSLGSVDGFTVENVTVHASMSWVIFAWNCESPQVRDVTIAPAEGSDRLIASIADGVHFVNCSGGPEVTGCHIENINDDGIVMNTIMVPVTAVDGRTIEVAERYYFDATPGHTVEAMAPDGTRSGLLPTVDSVTIGRFDAPKAITFESSVADRVSAGDHLLNYSVANRGYEIRNNTIRNNRARLIRLTSGDGMVAGNDLEGSSLAPILVESSAEEAEPTGWVDTVAIRNNRIARAGLNHMGGDRADGIYITHRSPNGAGTGGRPHRKIQISGNRFEGAANRAIYAADVEGLEIVDNDFSDLNQLDYDRFRDAAGYAMAFEDARDVTVDGNDVTGTSDRLAELGWRRDSEGFTLRNNRLTIDGDSKEPKLLRDG